MRPYLKAVRESDLLIFSTHNSIVGKGVYSEVKTALKYKIPIFVIEKNSTTLAFAFYQLESIEIVNERDWMNYAKIDLATPLIEDPTRTKIEV